MPDTCATCKNWMGMKPGHGGICMEKQKGRKWNEGMAVTNENDTCDHYKPKE